MHSRNRTKRGSVASVLSHEHDFTDCFEDSLLLEVLEMWNKGARPRVWFLNTATASFTFMLRNWSIIKNVTCFILFGMYFYWTRWGPHLGKACIIVIVCSVLCLLSCFTDLFGQLFLFSSLNELLPFLSINMFTHLNLRKIRLPIENIEMYIVNKNV